MVLHDTYPLHFFSFAAVSCAARFRRRRFSADLRNSLCSNTFNFSDLSPCRSFAIFDLGTELTENQCQSVSRSAVPLGR